MGISFHRGPAGEPERGLIYQGLCEMDEGGPRKEHCSLKRFSAEGLWGGLFYWGPWKICYERLRIRASLSIGAPLGNLEEIHLPGLLREKNSISGFLSWAQKTLTFYFWGPSGILIKGQGSAELISDYGA
jgi:hypothetical protein